MPIVLEHKRFWHKVRYLYIHIIYIHAQRNTYQSVSRSQKNLICTHIRSSVCILWSDPVHLVYNDEATSEASCLFERSAPECITFSGGEEDTSAKCNQQWWNPSVQDFIVTRLPILLAGRSSNQKERCTCSHLFPGNSCATYYSRGKVVSFPGP